jgi:hypothetical protein
MSTEMSKVPEWASKGMQVILVRDIGGHRPSQREIVKTTVTSVGKVSITVAATGSTRYMLSAEGLLGPNTSKWTNPSKIVSPTDPGVQKDIASHNMKRILDRMDDEMRRIRSNNMKESDIRNFREILVRAVRAVDGILDDTK